MTWALQDVQNVDELVPYEAALNGLCCRYPQVILCLYDLERFDGELVLDVLKTHPKVLVGGVVMENPYHLRPDDVVVARS